MAVSETIHASIAVVVVVAVEVVAVTTTRMVNPIATATIVVAINSQRTEKLR